MSSVTKLVLDVLKPHQPNALVFSQAIAEEGDDYRVHMDVIEVDENTETVKVAILGKSIDFEAIKSVITSLGGSLHSIDEVEVQSEADVD